MENLTVKEKQAIEKLKNIFFHELTPRLLEDDTLFYRFAKARDFNLKNAETMLRKHLADRKIYDLEEIASGNYTAPEHMNEYFAVSFLGLDKGGHIVRYIDLGGADHKGIVALFSFKEIIQFNANYIEKDAVLLRKQSKELGKSVSTMSFIINLDKFSLYKSTFKKGIQTMLDGFQLYQDNYPERMKTVYIINASYYFYIAFNILRTVLSAALLQKILIFDRNDWQEALLKDIDAEVLPAFLGGKRTDPDGDPMCRSFIVHGKLIPEELYLNKKKKTIRQEKGVQKLTVSRFSSSELLFYIIEPNTHIEWEFESKSRDIAFGLYYKSDWREKSKVRELIPKQRIDTIYSSETGFYKCNEVGTYIIVFDNSYSWIHSKEIYYRFRLVKPNCTKVN